MIATIVAWAGAAKRYAGVTVIALLVGAVALYVGVLRFENNDLQQANSTLTTKTITLTTEKAQLEDNVRTLEALRQIDAKAAQTLSETLTREGARAAELNDRLKEIENAPATDDGAVAPVLRRALERLPRNP